MFITGTLGYFDTEIDRWMKPELAEHAADKPVNLQQNITAAQHRLSQQASNATQWTILPQATSLESHRPRPFLKISWRNKSTNKGRRRHSEVLNPLTAEPVQGRATSGGQTLYKMHYLLHYFPRDTAFKFVGTVALIMFISLITGIVAHKKIFKEFFTFRPDKGNNAWLSGHKLLSVSSLPFQLMITYSGLLFAMNTLMPMITLGSYGFDENAVSTDLATTKSEIIAQPANRQAQLVDINTVIDSATFPWRPERIHSIEVKNPGDKNALIIFSTHLTSPGSTQPKLIFNGVSGLFIETRKEKNNTPLYVRRTFIDLHEGIYAGPLLRWLYFFSGLLGAGMIATGAVYWVKKRQRKKSAIKTSTCAVAVLNTATIIGLPIAIGCYFLANRLLPVSLPNRAEWEVNTIFLVWGVTLIIAIFRPASHVWRELFCCAASVYLAIPIVNAMTTKQHIWHSLINNDWTLFSVDFIAILLAFLFSGLAWRLRNKVDLMSTNKRLTRATS